MITCSEECIPCCDYCKEVEQGSLQTPDGKTISTGPIGCNKYTDAEHQNIARSCSYCDDFHCKEAK